ncbi:MAG: hypothetical protein RJA59_416 [Pseudomonadota bacterium]
MSEWDQAAALLLAGRHEDIRNLPSMQQALRRAEVVARVRVLVDCRDLSVNSACRIVANREGYSEGQVRAWWFDRAG